MKRPKSGGMTQVPPHYKSSKAKSLIPSTAKNKKTGITNFSNDALLHVSKLSVNYTKFKLDII
jgi:hypothetical protein